MAPADPAGPRPAPRPAAVIRQAPAGAMAHRAVLLSPVLAAVRGRDGVELPAQRRLRGSRRARVHALRRRAPGTGNPARPRQLRRRISPAIGERSVTQVTGTSRSPASSSLIAPSTKEA